MNISAKLLNSFLVVRSSACPCTPLVLKLKILLLDEPLSALDGVIKESIKDKIRQIAKEFHLTTIIVIHDPEEALVFRIRL